MSKVPSTVSARVETAARMYVLVLPHIVRGCVVLAANCANEPLLAVGKLSDAVSLFLLLVGGGWLNLVSADHVVGVVVRSVMVSNIIIICTRGSGSACCNKTRLFSSPKRKTQQRSIEREYILSISFYPI